MSAEYIARQKADLNTLLRYLVQVQSRDHIERFDGYCARRSARFDRSGATVTLESLASNVLGEKVQAEKAVEALQSEAQYGRNAEIVLRRAVIPEVLPGDKTEEDILGDFLAVMMGEVFLLAEALVLLAPDFARAGIPFDLVSREITAVRWDLDAGCPGVWRKLKPGKFLMGEPGKARVTQVTDPFLISVFLYTNGQALANPKNEELCYRAPWPQVINGVVDLGPGYYKENDAPFYLKTDYAGVGRDITHPIQANLSLPLVGLTYSGAEKLAQNDGVDLPSNMQWEYAARYDGPQDEEGVRQGYLYPVGPSLLDGEGKVLAHMIGPGRKAFPYAAPVGSYPREAGNGIYDMTGNVLEWISSGHSLRGGPWSRGTGGDCGEALFETHVEHLGSAGPSTYIGFRPVINLPA